MQLRIRKWGNSAALRLPASVLERSGLSIGDVVEVNSVRGVLTIVVSKPIYSLTALIAQCNPDAPPPADMVAWNLSQTVGHEAI